MIIYTDGSAKPNPGPGGFGVIVLDNDKNLIDIHQEEFEYTTNNEMELKAILYAMLKYGKNKEEFLVPVVYSDSSYSVNIYNDWMFKWANNNWLKSDNKIPENLKLIQAYYNYYQQGYRIDLQKVKGHAGIKENEIVDGLATGRLSIKKVREMYGK